MLKNTAAMKDLKITKGEMTPQKFIGEKVSYDQAGQMIFGHKGDKLQLLLDIRGWGAIQHLFSTEKEAADFQDALGEWYAEAINEKLQDKTSKLLKQNEELREALKSARLQSSIPRLFDKMQLAGQAKMPSEEEVLRYFNNHFDCYADADHIEIAMTNTAVLKLIWWFRSRMSEPNNEGGDK